MGDETGKYVRISQHDSTEDLEALPSDAESFSGEEAESSSGEEAESISEAEAESEVEEDHESEEDSGGEVDPEDMVVSVANPANENESNSYAPPTEATHTTATEPPVVTTEMYAVLQKAIVDLAQVILEKPWEKSETAQPASSSNKAASNESWNQLGNAAPLTGGPSTIRLEGIPHFPKNVPTSGMWEAFSRFIEKFEIVLTLSNITDPAHQAQLLFIALGDELQDIVKVAELRPSLNDPECYRKMVTNITEYLHSLTDTAAEHEAFCQMKQEAGESTMSFYTRLKIQAKHCRYTEQPRFVRCQLLKGMANRELATAARTYGHSVELVIQSAARSEALVVEQRSSGNLESSTQSSVQAVTSIRDASRDFRHRGSSHQRPYRHSDSNNNHRSSRGAFRSYAQSRSRLGKRGRCSRCDRPAHRGGECPAKSQDCHRCGMRGHFAVTCRKKEANMTEEYRQTKAENDEAQV